MQRTLATQEDRKTQVHDMLDSSDGVAGRIQTPFFGLVNLLVVELDDLKINDHPSVHPSPKFAVHLSFLIGIFLQPLCPSFWLTLFFLYC